MNWYRLLSSASKRQLEILISGAIFSIFLIPFFTYICPYTETLRCFKVSNLCEIRSEYLFNKKRIEFLTFDKLDDVVLQKNRGRRGNITYTLSYSDKEFDSVLPIFLSSYESKEYAEEARLSIINFLSLNEKTFLLRKNEVMMLSLWALITLSSIALLIVFLKENVIINRNFQ